jgi:3-hydroxybutyryl-CoA dehydrogenase
MSIAAINILNDLNWKYQICADDPGMVSARIISMIVNEAYFALQDNVSTKEEIDIAMKLGTNYPLGPFEWSKKIGLERIYFLLEKLGKKTGRYQISQALINDLN